MTIFQLVCMLQIYINGTQASNVTLFTVYGVYIAAEWIYFSVFGLFLRRKSFEVELIAFFLTGIGLTLTTSVYPDKAFTQLAAVLMGIIVFIVMLATAILASHARRFLSGPSGPKIVNCASGAVFVAIAAWVLAQTFLVN